MLCYDSGVMMNADDVGARPLARSRGMDEREAAALARLADQYADELPGIYQRGTTLIPAVVHAVCGHQAGRLFADWTGSKEEPEDRAEDVADALSLLRAAHAELDGLEAALLIAARQPSQTGKPLLTFRKIADAIGAESEQAAQGRYRRKVGNLNGSDSGQDGTP